MLEVFGRPSSLMAATVKCICPSPVSAQADVARTLKSSRTVTKETDLIPAVLDSFWHFITKLLPRCSNDPNTHSDSG